MTFIGEQDFCPIHDAPVTIIDEHIEENETDAYLVIDFSCGHDAVMRPRAITV